MELRQLYRIPKEYKDILRERCPENFNGNIIIDDTFYYSNDSAACVFYLPSFYLSQFADIVITNGKFIKNRYGSVD